MERDAIRLELVKLFGRNGRPPAEAIANMRDYEKYIVEQLEETNAKPPRNSSRDQGKYGPGTLNPTLKS